MHTLQQIKSRHPDTDKLIQPFDDDVNKETAPKAVRLIVQQFRLAGRGVTSECSLAIFPIVTPSAILCHTTRKSQSLTLAPTDTSAGPLGI